MTGPERASQAEEDDEGGYPVPPGQFLTPELASDCARFLAELKERLRLQAESERGPSLGK